MTRALLSIARMRDPSRVFKAGLSATVIALSATVVGGAERSAATGPTKRISPILQDHRSFDTVATVLHIGAHPDQKSPVTFLAPNHPVLTTLASRVN